MAAPSHQWYRWGWETNYSYQTHSENKVCIAHKSTCRDTKVCSFGVTGHTSFVVMQYCLSRNSPKSGVPLQDYLQNWFSVRNLWVKKKGLPNTVLSNLMYSSLLVYTNVLVSINSNLCVDDCRSCRVWSCWWVMLFSCSLTACEFTRKSLLRFSRISLNNWMQNHDQSIHISLLLHVSIPTQ